MAETFFVWPRCPIALLEAAYFVKPINSGSVDTALMIACISGYVDLFVFRLVSYS